MKLDIKKTGLRMGGKKGMKSGPSGPVPISLDAKRYLKDRLGVFGIPLERAADYGLVALGPEQAKEVFPGQAVRAGIGFHYDELDGTHGPVHRIRELPSGKPKARRYVSRAGSRAKIYLPRVNGINWEAVTKGAIPRLLIVEGELKALACCLAGEFAVGIGGVTMWGDGQGGLHPILLALITAVSGEVVVVFDSDTSTNKKVAAQFRKLLGAIHKEGKRAVGIITPGKHGEKVGIDDYIFAEGPKKAAERLTALIEEKRGTISKLVAKQNERWKWIEDRTGNRIIEITEKQVRVLSMKSFVEGREEMIILDKEGKASKVNEGTWWSKQPEKETYIGTVLCPFTDEQDLHGAYNLYTPLHKPDVIPDVSLCDEALNAVWGKEGAYWLRLAQAYYFQRRMRPSWAPYIVGKDEGTGKTIAGRISLAPLGHRHIKYDGSLRGLMAPFGKSVLEDHLGILCEEGAEDDAGGRKAREFCKQLLDSPTHEIECKGIGRYSIPNNHQFYFGANSSRLIHIDKYDRRFLVRRVPTGFKLDERMRIRLNELLYGGQEYRRLPIREDVSWALRQRRMKLKIPDTFDPGRAPMTPDKLLVIGSDHSNLEHEIHDLVENQVWCGHEMGEIYDVQMLAGVFNTRYSGRGEGVAEGSLRHHLREEGFVPHRVQVKGPPHVDRTLWCAGKSLPKLSKLTGVKLLQMAQCLLPVGVLGGTEKPKIR